MGTSNIVELQLILPSQLDKLSEAVENWDIGVQFSIVQIIAKRHGHQMRCHMTALLSDGNSSNPGFHCNRKTAWLIK